jgi:Fic family protein
LSGAGASEVHPFADGNGRTARVMMNAELEAAREVRIIIPTVFRLNYLAALKAATHNENYAALVASLAFARRWTARVDFTSRETAEADLHRTHALRDAREAEDTGIRLTLP